MRTVSASELKNNVADILSRVYFHGEVTMVERYGKPIAEIMPPEKSRKSRNLDEVLDKYFGTLPDFPDVTKFRRSRRKKLTLDL